MTEDVIVSCVGVGAAPMMASWDPDAVPAESRDEEGGKMAVARVGGKAPDFTATAYFEGTFKRVSLSDYGGKWVLLCFYPGDFTFV